MEKWNKASIRYWIIIGWSIIWLPSCQVNPLQTDQQSPVPMTNQQIFDQLYLDDQILAGNFINANVHPEYAEITERLTQFVEEGRLSKIIGQSVEFRVMLLHHYHKGMPIFLDSLENWLARGIISEQNYTEYWGYVTDDPQAVAAMNSRRTVRRKVQNATKPFYLLGTETLTAELYLGDQIQREVQTWRIDDSYFYLIDWNQNGSFTDLGVDQIAADKLKAWPPKLQPLKAQNTLQTDRKTVVFSPLEPLALAFDLSPSTDSVDLELISILPDCLHLQNAELDNQLTAALNTSEGLALYFWATWCQPCVKKIKLLETTDYFENGIQYIPICVKSSRSSLEALKAKNEWRFPPFLLADSEADALGIYQIPTTLILDPKKRAITRQ